MCKANQNQTFNNLKSDMPPLILEGQIPYSLLIHMLILFLPPKVSGCPLLLFIPTKLNWIHRSISALLGYSVTRQVLSYYPYLKPILNNDLMLYYLQSNPSLELSFLLKITMISCILSCASFSVLSCFSHFHISRCVLKLAEPKRSAYMTCFKAKLTRKAVPIPHSTFLLLIVQ